MLTPSCSTMAGQDTPAAVLAQEVRLLNTQQPYPFELLVDAYDMAAARAGIGVTARLRAHGQLWH